MGYRIGVDFDGVINNFQEWVCIQLRQNHNVDFTVSDIDGWDPEVSNTDARFEDYVERNTTNDNLIHELTPVNGVRSQLNTLLDNQHEVIVASHRPTHQSDAIREWLDNYSIPYCKYVDDVPEEKAKLDIDILIDDHPPHITTMASNGGLGIHFTGVWHSTTGNVTSVNGAVRATSWEEVKQIIRRWENYA